MVAAPACSDAMSSKSGTIWSARKGPRALVALAGAPDANKFFRIQNTGAAWSTTGDPVQAAGDPQSFGPTAAALAAGGTDLVFAQDGSDEGLYVQKRSAGAWSSAAPIVGAGTYANFVPPALVGVDGKFDLVLLYATNAAPHVIGFATRDAITKAWSTAAATQALAGTLSPWSGATDLFITPGFPFRVVDALLTNFHMPRTTLMVLVSALASRDLVMRAYAEAIRERYRMLSYGDAMLIL